MDIKGDLINVVMKVAPSLAGALAGPAGGLVASLITSVFGESHSSDELAQKIQADPESSIKLKTIEMQHEQVLKQLEVRSYEIETKDRQDARIFNDSTHSWVLPVIAIGYSGLFAFLIGLDALKLVPINANAMQDLYSIALIVVNFYLGSSHSALRAQAALNKR